MGIQIKGLKNLQVKMAGLSKEDIESTLERAALMVETDAKDNCPESGLAGIQGFGGSSLKDSITHEVENNEAAIGTNKDYAMYVHHCHYFSFCDLKTLKLTSAVLKKTTHLQLE